MGKGEIARYEQFLLFPQCFQKACFPGASKGVIVWEWVKTLWGKKKLSLKSNFSFSPNVFYPFREFSAILLRFKILSVWRSLKYVVSETVNADFNIISLISQEPVHISMLSWHFFHQNFTQYFFKATGYFPYFSHCQHNGQQLERIWLLYLWLTLSQMTNFRLFQNERVCRQQF